MTDQEREIQRVISYIRSCREARVDTTITIDKSRNHFILNVLEEIQQYRAIGTVEECRLYKGISEKDFSTACLDLKIIDELREYKDIGTVEECLEARERQRAKKPIKDEYSHDCCPNCG